MDEGPPASETRPARETRCLRPVRPTLARLRSSGPERSEMRLSMSDIIEIVIGIVGEPNVSVGDAIREDHTHDECLTVDGVVPLAVVCPADHGRGGGCPPGVRRAARGCHGARGRHRVVGRMHSDGRRDRHLVRTDGRAYSRSTPQITWRSCSPA